MNPELITTIKSRGYWRINFQPLVNETKLNLVDTKNIIDKNSIKLRGWYYPYFPIDDSGLDVEVNFYRGWIDWAEHKEFWQMFQSGQFIQYLALREDWQEDGVHWGSKTINPGEKIEVISSIFYQITEFFEFLSRLVQNNIYDEGVSVSISLNNTDKRELWLSDPMRGSFMQKYKTSAENITFSKIYTAENLLKNPHEESLVVILHFCERFGWHTAPIETIKNDQKKLLNGL